MKRSDPALAALMAAALTLVAYGRSLRAPLTWDDMDVVTPAGVPLRTKDIPSYFGSAHWLTVREAGPRPYRPLRDSYLALLRDLGAGKPWPFHAGNLLLQTVNVFLVWALARRLMAGAGPWLAAAVFAAHPMHLEVVSWTKNSAELLALALALASLLCFQRAFVAGRPKALGLWLGSVLLYVLALLCKESALPLPALVVLWALLWLQGGERWRAVVRSVPFWFAGLAYAACQHAFLATRSAVPAAAGLKLDLPSRLLLGGETIAAYFQALLLPVLNRPLVEFWPYPRAELWQAALVALGFAAAGGLLVAHVLRGSKPSFGFWWLLLALAPVSNLVQFNSARPIAEQRLYLPSVGFALLIGALASSVAAATSLHARARRVALAACAAMVAAFCLLTLRAGPMWDTGLSFWRWTARTSPHSHVPWYNLGIMYAQAAETPRSHPTGAAQADRREIQAEQSYLRALWLNPRAADVALNLANSFKRRGDYRTAAVSYRRALAVSPAYALAHFNLGHDYLLLGDKEKAERHMRLAGHLDPQCARNAHRYLAQLLADRGRKDEALREAMLALAANESDRPVHLLAARLLGEAGRPDQAAAHVRRAIELGREDPALLLLEASLLRAADQASAAQAPLRRAIALLESSRRPGQEDLQNLALLVEAYLLAGEKPKAQELLRQPSVAAALAADAPLRQRLEQLLAAGHEPP